MELDNIKVPDELEGRLRIAINKSSKKKGKGLIAAVLILFVICFYGYDAIAYYGKRILGYDKTMYGNIKELNEKGRGQEINKSFRFNDGTEIKLDGIIFDDNKLIAFIKEYSISGFDKTTMNYSINGLRFMKYGNQSGAGNYNKERTEINWIFEFEPPAIYEKWLSLEITKIADGKVEEGKIKFTLDRNKAMGHTVKQDINKTVSIEDINIKFDKITISPIAAVVDGEITGGPSFNGDFLTNGNTDHPLVDFDLIINGKAYNCGSRSMGGSNEKMQFKNESITVPSDVQTLKINNIKLATEVFVDKMVKIKSDSKDLKVDTQKGNIIIKKVRQDNKSTYITIKSDMDFNINDNPVLTIFSAGNEFASSKQVIDSRYSENGREYTERTFKFETLGDEMELGIKVVYEIKRSSEVIDIPVGK
jgi:cbb3-type cytochrome oxidase subunit 3